MPKPEKITVSKAAPPKRGKSSDRAQSGPGERTSDEFAVDEDRRDRRLASLLGEVCLSSRIWLERETPVRQGG